MTTADPTPKRPRGRPRKSTNTGAEIEPNRHGDPARFGEIKPARGYRWEPFQQGHLINMTAGHRAPRVYEPIARELVTGLLEDHPDLVRFPELLSAWADAEARAYLLRLHLSEHGMLGEDFEPKHSLLSWLQKFETTAARRREDLGLTPSSEAKIARERTEASILSVDLQAIAARGREALDAQQRAREQGLLPPEPPDPIRAALEAARQSRNGHAPTAATTTTEMP